MSFIWIAYEHGMTFEGNYKEIYKDFLPTSEKPHRILLSDMIFNSKNTSSKFKKC
jgi:hypothetical protein